MVSPQRTGERGDNARSSFVQIRQIVLHFIFVPMRIFLTVFASLLLFSVKAQQPVFPASFTGKWKGKLQWAVAGKPTREFTMQLNILPADTAGQYTWQIIYGDDNKDNRPYLLKPADSSSNHWVIDERDGIILDSYVHGNCLQGAFTVNQNTIIDNYCIENGRMRVEFFTVKLGDKKQSGKGTEDVPFVNSYRIGGYQWGILEKVN